MKYHPEDSSKRKSDLKSNVRDRLGAFMNLLDMGRIDSTPLDIEKLDPIILLLDSG